MPARLTPAIRVVTGPRLRGTAPRARIPRAARALRRVIEGARAALVDEHSPRPDRCRSSDPPTRPAPARRARGRAGFFLQRPPRPPPAPAPGAVGPRLRPHAG